MTTPNWFKTHRDQWNAYNRQYQRKARATTKERLKARVEVAIPLPLEPLIVTLYCPVHSKEFKTLKISSNTRLVADCPECLRAFSSLYG